MSYSHRASISPLSYGQSINHRILDENGEIGKIRELPVRRKISVFLHRNIYFKKQGMHRGFGRDLPSLRTGGI